MASGSSCSDNLASGSNCSGNLPGENTAVSNPHIWNLSLEWERYPYRPDNMYVPSATTVAAADHPGKYSMENEVIHCHLYWRAD